MSTKMYLYELKEYIRFIRPLMLVELEETLNAYSPRGRRPLRGCNMDRLFKEALLYLIRETFARDFLIVDSDYQHDPFLSAIVDRVNNAANGMQEVILASYARFWEMTSFYPECSIVFHNQTQLLLTFSNGLTIRSIIPCLGPGDLKRSNELDRIRS